MVIAHWLIDSKRKPKTQLSKSNYSFDQGVSRILFHSIDKQDSDLCFVDASALIMVSL